MAEIIYIDSNDSEIIKGDVYKDDTRTAELFQQAGFSHIPEKDDEGVLVYIGNGKSNGIIIATKNRNGTIKEKGETFIYAIQDGTIKSSFYMNKNGKIIIDSDDNIESTSGGDQKIDGNNIELNGNTKKFVTYTELNQALQLLITALNSHIHTGVTTGSGSSGTPGTPLTLDISAAETQTIKTGG